MNLTINNQTVLTKTARTVLDLAQEKDIYIPTLCAHPELTSYGGCRLCIVEVEGMKGYPTACTTQLQEGMNIRTESQTIQEMRKDLIQLILSEHPSACLICEEVDGCSSFQDTIRKVGVTTGCRWCPKDKDCELQKVVDYLGVEELILPGLYRNLPLEKYDPFFDRDYNLCIYCGRCVRICSEFRKSNVLSLKQRGKLTTIGPAFDETHIEAGCEFCGACVSVCPTGAMSEKSKKWWGTPEKFAKSNCPLCSLNCELQVLTSKSKIIGTTPSGDPHQSGGVLCVKGRFCLSELVNRTERVLEPEYKYRQGYGIVDWKFAMEKAKEIFNDVKPGRSAMFISPSLTNEEIHAAGSFAKTVLKTGMISSSCLNSDLAAYLNLGEKTAGLKDISRADNIVSFFLNGNYKYAPVTMGIKDAAANGIPYFQVGWIKDTTTRFAKKRYIPGNGNTALLLDDLQKTLKNGKIINEELGIMVQALKKGRNNLFIVGPEIMSINNCQGLMGSIRDIARRVKARILIVNQYGNLPGLLSSIELVPKEEIDRKIKAGKIDLVYLIGDLPYSRRPNVKYVVYQNAFPSPMELAPDLIMPTTIWGEHVGSYISFDKKAIKLKAVASPHGYARPHDTILADISKTLATNNRLSKYKKTNGVAIQLPGYDNLISGKKSNPVNKTYDNKYPFTLFQEYDQHVYSSYSLGKGLEGMNELVKPGHIHIHPADAIKNNLSEGDEVWLSSSKEKKKFKVTLRKNIETGFLFLVTGNQETEFADNPCHVKIRRENV